MPTIELKKVKHLIERLPSYKKYLVITIIGAIFVFLSFYIYKTYFSKMRGSSYVEGYANGMDMRGAGNNNNVATLYLFKTDWCPHCKQIKPMWDKFVEDNENKEFNGYKVQYVTIDCDQDPSTADKFNIKGYPTIKLDVRGEVIEFQGKPDEEALNQFLSSTLK
jgi:thiol-disulfide isomerase/thioredoxin